MNIAKIRSVKILNVFFWVIAIALLINVVRIAVPRLKVHALTFQAKPSRSFTSTLSETVYDAQGHAQGSLATYTWAVRSDGSRVARIELPDGRNIRQREIAFASGESVSINEIRHMKSTIKNSDGNSDDWIRDPKSNCVSPVNGQRMKNNELLSEKQDVNGYHTVKIAVKTGKDTLTSWYAPDYGCAIVKFEAKWDGGARTEQDLVTLLPGEPSPALFSVPADFAEVAPSKMLPSEISSDTAQRIDRKYYAQHAQ